MDGSMIQAVLNLSKLVDGTDLEQFMRLSRLAQRGDHTCKSCNIRTSTKALGLTNTSS